MKEISKEFNVNGSIYNTNAPIYDIKNSLAISRINDFKTEKRALEVLLKHYKKIKRRLGSADTIIKIVGIGSTFVLTLGTILLPVFLSIATTVPIVLGSVSAFDIFISETVSIGWTSKKRKLYREVCIKLDTGIARLTLYQNKALSDRILFNEEIEQAAIIIKDEIRRIKYVDEDKFVKTEIKSELKREYENKIKSLNRI